MLCLPVYLQLRIGELLVICCNNAPYEQQNLFNNESAMHGTCLKRHLRASNAWCYGGT